MSTVRERYHIYPVDKKNRSTHCTDKTGMCWCKPEEMQTCPEQPDHQAYCPEDCWKCGGTGIIPVYDDHMAILIIHKHGQAKVQI